MPGHVLPSQIPHLRRHLQQPAAPDVGRLPHALQAPPAAQIRKRLQHASRSGFVCCLLKSLKLKNFCFVRRGGVNNLLSSLERNRKPGLGSWNKEVRAHSGLYRVREVAVAVVCNCVVRAVLLPYLYSLGIRSGHLVCLGACLYSSLRSSGNHWQQSLGFKLHESAIELLWKETVQRVRCVTT